MAKQPFHHRAVILFTATEDVGRGMLEELLRDALKLLLKKDRPYGIVMESVVCEEIDSEAGDPADL